MSLTEHEANKYDSIWSLPEYSKMSPGAKFVDLFMELSGAMPVEAVVDFGAGAGAASRILKDKGLNVVAVDIVDTAWKHEDIPFVKGCLWKPLPLLGTYRYGFCCDVMEHIPPQFTGLVLNNILSRCQDVFFSIAFHHDGFGAAIGDDLHLTVQPFEWWLGMLEELAVIHNARDLLDQGVFYVSRRGANG